MRLLHFGAIEDTTKPVEYVVIVEDDSDSAGEQREGYELRSESELTGDQVDMLPQEVALWPRS